MPNVTNDRFGAIPERPAAAAPEHPQGFLPPNPAHAAPTAAAEPAPAAPAGRRPGPWLRWGRWVMLGLCGLAGALFAWNPDRWSDYPVGVGMVVGALGALLSVYLYGFIAWVVIRGLARRRAWTYVRTAYSPLILGLVFVGMLGLPASRAANDNRGSGSGARVQGGEDVVAAMARAPDPVGKKLAGQSDQIGDADTRRLVAHSDIGLRFNALTGRVVRDYLDDKVSADTWMDTTASRLRQSAKAVSAMRQGAAALTDEPSRLQLQRLDRDRSRLQSALTALLASVRSGDNARERAVGKLTDRRLAELHATSRHLATLMEPYFSAEQRKLFEKGAGA